MKVTPKSNIETGLVSLGLPPTRSTSSTTSWRGSRFGSERTAATNSRRCSAGTLPIWALSTSSSSQNAQLNGKVERSHRTDEDEFYQLLTYRGDVNLEKKLAEWERF